MKGFRLRRSGAAAASVVLALALSGGALLWARPSPHSASPAKPARSAGGKIFDKWCSDCHAAGGPGSLALQRKYQSALPAILEQRKDLTPDYIRVVVRQGVSFMPSSRKTEISDADLALLTGYLAPTRDASSDEAARKKASGE